MSDCLFCKIVAGEIPSSKVYEDDVCYAFNDIDPQAPTHFLVVPKAHIGSVSEITADIDLDLALGLPVTETENAQITAKLQMDMQMDVNATGDDVRISYPSFSNFEDLTPALSGGEL